LPDNTRKQIKKTTVNLPRFFIYGWFFIMDYLVSVFLLYNIKYKKIFYYTAILPVVFCIFVYKMGS